MSEPRRRYVCPTCGCVEPLDQLKVPRDPSGRVAWTAEFCEALEAHHVFGGRSYKWLAAQLGLSYSALTVGIWQWKAGLGRQSGPDRRHGRRRATA